MVMKEGNKQMKKRVQLGLLVLVLGVSLSGCCLSHEWEEATCTEPEICTKCGETQGEPEGHEWEEATCTQPEICSVCEETQGEPLAHIWRDATLEEAKTCEGCGLTEGVTNKEAILEAADAFLKAIDEVDKETLSDSCMGFVLLDMGMGMLSTKACEDAFYEAAEIDREWISTEAQGAVTEYARSCADALIQGYVVKDVTEHAGVYTVSATINTYESSSLSALNTEELEGYMEELAEEYIDENMDTLMSIYLLKGEEAYKKQVYNDLIPEILGMCEVLLEESEMKEVEILFNMKKLGEHWVVTSMDKMGKEENSTL